MIVKEVDRFGMIDPAAGHEPLYWGRTNDIQPWGISGEEYVRLSDYNSLINPPVTDGDRITYWKSAYERMATRNIELSDHNAKMLEALDHIAGMSLALRQGGPDPIDLHGLSDALSEAVELANTVVVKAEGC